MRRDYSEGERFHRLAHERRVPSRAFFKIEEIVDRILKRRFECVIDLGCSPGGWSSFLIKRAKKVIGIDLKDTPIKNERFVFLKGDAGDAEMIKKVRQYINRADGIFSDMSPSISGIPDADQERAYELFCIALKYTEEFLEKGGCAVIKAFQGQRFEDLVKEMKKHFERVRIFKPSASRRSVREVYVVGMNFKKEVIRDGML